MADRDLNTAAFLLRTIDMLPMMESLAPVHVKDIGPYGLAIVLCQCGDCVLLRPPELACISEIAIFAEPVGEDLASLEERLEQCPAGGDGVTVHQPAFERVPGRGVALAIV
ncbi:hypothetical protein [Sphingobium yanoikuyae]|uniref:Uncharacterized protein n=1 Tax=Sphingobium yanoikuyae TaxID=13690 RepID=A0A9X7UHJ7_SPHYA|nr:hypothetical protein [Sphingobium yanoikuyae]QNG47977.1 hypothetical protein H3V42_10545 [Sphingobium yanoikuyae]